MRQVIALFVLAAPLYAQPPAPQAPPLAGPKVDAPVIADIIERGFDGLVKPAEPTPEEAALNLLTLSDAEREATGAILAARLRIINDFMTNNIPLLTQFGNAEGSGDKKEQFALAYTAFIKLKPLVDKGPLQNELRAVLTSENAAKFDATLKRYWSAYIKDRSKVKKPDGKYPNRIEIMAEAKLQSFGKEAERAFKQMMDGGEFIYRYLFRGIELRPDQREKLHDITDTFARTTKGNPTNDQNGQLFFNILPILDEAQRPKLMENIRELSGAAPAKKKPAKTMSAPMK